MNQNSIINNKSNLNEDKIHIFYHVYQVAEWELLFQQQIYSLVSSGLYERCKGIYICINGDKSLPFELEKFQIQYNTNFYSEKDTLLKIWKLCNFLENSKILYLHTKSVSYHWHLITKTNVDAWRIYMEHFLIKNWEKCVELLNDFDCVGTEYNTFTDCVFNGENGTLFKKNNIECYSGNFWWVNSNYFKTLNTNFLDDISHFIIENNKNKNQITENDLKKLKRFNCEWWLFEKKPNFYNVCNLDVFNFGPSMFYEKNCSKIFLEKIINYDSKQYS
jgi:hypothetical protein